MLRPWAGRSSRHPGMHGRAFIVPFNDMNCRYGKFCVVSVWSTPKSSADHARQIRRVVDKCVRLGNDLA